jgi:hypothetical protein
MTTTTISRSTARPMMAETADATWVGGAPYVLSMGLALVAMAAVVGALFLPDAIRGPAVSVGNLQGTALVLGLVTLPVLAVAMVLVARGMTAVAIAFWLGALGSIAYQSVLFLFGVPFNSFFFAYVAMLSLSVWAMVALGGRIPIDHVGGRIGRNAPVRLVAAYLLINALLFGGLWLRATVPAVLTGDPTFLEGTGMLTGPVQIIDFAFTLPLMILAAVLLLRRRPWGYLLSGALLVMLAIETASIGVDQWMGHAADPSSPAAAAMTPVFAVMTAIGLLVLALFVRRGPPQSKEPAEDERLR